MDSTKGFVDRPPGFVSVRATEAQKEVWLSVQIGPDASRAYNESVTLRISGQLDRDALRKALNLIAQKHDSLRSTFSNDGQQVVITQWTSFPLQEADITSLSAAEQRREIESWMWDEAELEFDLLNGPLIRGRLVSLSETEHLLILTAHHVCCDEKSVGLLLQQLADSYSRLVTKRPLRLDSPDCWQQHVADEQGYLVSSKATEDLGYWLERFADAPPDLDLPTDNPRPAIKTYRAARASHHLPAPDRQRLEAFAAAHGAELSTLMLAGFQSFLFRITNQEDIVVAIPAADRGELIGHRTNLLPIRVQIDPNMSLTELLEAVRSNLSSALEHSRVTFGTLLQHLNPQRDPGRLPLVATMISFSSLPAGALGFAGLQTQLEPNPRRFENFDLSLAFHTNQGGCDLHCHFNLDLFDQSTIEELLESYLAMVRNWVEQPGAPLQRVQLLSSQQQRMLAAWNQTEAEYPHCSIQQAIREQSLKTPDRIAVIDEFGNQLTFHELEARSNQLARYLAQQNVEPGCRVGVSPKRSVDMVLTTLAVLKTGAAYVPLDPEYPVERLHYMCRDSNLSLLVTTSDLADTYRDAGIPILALDQEAEAIKRHRMDEVQLEVPPEATAYVIYTSGSTGRPKGVQIPHRAVVNFLLSMADKPGIEANDRLLAVTTLSFDIAVLELFLPLLTGAVCVIANRETVADGARLRESIERNGITYLQATPSTWRLLIDSGWQGNRQLKILSGGEQLPEDLVAPMLERSSSVWNMYGPTETTVWSSCFQVEDATSRILVGRPINNTQLYVLDCRGEPVPAGVPGELYIAGDGVALGYLNRPELSRKQFLEKQLVGSADRTIRRLYRTGDLVRFRSDGNLEYLRRIDRQVKLRGYRIELAEVEQALTSHHEISRAVALVREDSPGDSRLVAYFVASADTPTSSELRQHLRGFLPYYMIPQHFVELETLPMTSNGKLDLGGLPIPFVTSVQTEDRVPESATETMVAEAWKRLLAVPAVGLSDNFFSLGGHSLLATRCIADIQQRCGIRVSVRHLLMCSLEQLAATIDQLSEES